MKLPEIRPNVITSFDAQLNPNVEEDSNFAKIIGYIPGEVVATYIGISNILSQLILTNDSRITSLWAFAILFFIATPIYVYFFPKDKTQNKPSLVFHAIYAMIAFGVWVFALGGPFEACCKLVVENEVITGGWWQPGWGGIAILLVTFFSPAAEKFYFWLYSWIRKKLELK